LPGQRKWTFPCPGRSFFTGSTFPWFFADFRGARCCFHRVTTGTHVFSVYSVFPVLHVFVRFGRFRCSDGSFNRIQATERVRYTFSPFSPCYTFTPVSVVFAVPTVHFTVSKRPSVNVTRFLRFPRVTRFLPFRPFWLFRRFISPYPSDRTWMLHAFSVLAVLHVFTRFGRFSCSDWSFHHIQPTERVRYTFYPFNPCYTFLPVLAFFAVPTGHFTVSNRPNVFVTRYLRSPCVTCFRPYWPFSLFRLVISLYPSDRVLPVLAVTTGRFTVCKRPNVKVTRFLRFGRSGRVTRFRPFSLLRLVISPYPSDRTCTFHVFSVFYVLHVFARFGRYRCSD
jgi:hypothetical protein